MTEVPVPTLPAGMTMEWSQSQAALFLACARCGVTEVLYTVLLLRDPSTLARVAEGHRCAPSTPSSSASSPSASPPLEREPEADTGGAPAGAALAPGEHGERP